jgi:hypothetical protein
MHPWAHRLRSGYFANVEPPIYSQEVLELNAKFDPILTLGYTPMYLKPSSDSIDRCETPAGITITSPVRTLTSMPSIASCSFDRPRARRELPRIIAEN